MGLFGDPDPEVVKRDSEVDIPGWYEDPLRRLIGAAESIAEEEYQPYEGPRIAGLDPHITQAHQSILGEVGGYKQPLMEAMALTREGAKGIPDVDLSQYMSPYMQNVIDQSKRETIRDYDVRQAGENRRIGTSGAFGGTRHAIREAEGERNLSRNLADIQERGLQAAYDRALTSFDKDQRSKFMAAEGLGALSGVELQRLLQSQGAVEDIGRTYMGLDQAGMDLAYQDFLEQRDWPKSQAGWFSNILHGTPSKVIGQDYTETTQAPGTSTLSQIFGLGVGLFGGDKPLISGQNITDAVNWVSNIFNEGGLVEFADGGHVQAFADGGTPAAGSWADLLSGWNQLTTDFSNLFGGGPGGEWGDEATSEYFASERSPLGQYARSLTGEYGDDLLPTQHLQEAAKVQQKGPLGTKPKTLTDKLKIEKEEQLQKAEELSPVKRILKAMDKELKGVGSVDQRLRDSKQMNTWLAALSMMDQPGKDPLGAIASGLKTGLKGYQADKSRIMKNMADKRKDIISEYKTRAEMEADAKRAEALMIQAQRPTGSKASQYAGLDGYLKMVMPHLSDAARGNKVIGLLNSAKAMDPTKLGLEVYKMLAESPHFERQPQKDQQQAVNRVITMIRQAAVRQGPRGVTVGADGKHRYVPPQQ